MNIYRTGLQNKICANSLIDGEWITSLKDETPINRYFIFDIYVYNDVKVSNLPFATFIQGGADNGKIDPESRYYKLDELCKKWNKGVTVLIEGLKAENSLILLRKQFQFAAGNDIFKECGIMLDKTQLYNTDGLIITSNTHPLPDKFGARFSNQFKWKPSKDNTIDFLIRFEKNISTTIDEITGETNRYKTMRLYVGGIRSKIYENPRITILNELDLDQKEDVKYGPILFQPLQFMDSQANQCNINIQIDPNTDEEYVMTEYTKEPIQNYSIVEMRYDINKEAGWRWTPTRIRHDKTERLIRAEAKGGNIKYTGMMNNDATANSIWNSIHDPITPSMIRTGNEEPIAEEMFSTSTDMTLTYYERKASKENIALVKGLRDFHNKYIKNMLLIQSTMTRDGRYKKILDIACGEASDLYKWKFANASYVFGIDIASNNITNSNSGAYKRYIEAVKEFGKARIPKIVFAIGDSSKSIINGEAGASAQDRDIMRSIFGKIEPEEPVPPYITHVMKDSLKNGADVVACMFAIHYFFKNKDTLAGLLKNLSDTVKMGGYFIGCCFDGDTVFKMLESVDHGKSVNGIENGVSIWNIVKEYDDDTFLPDESSLGKSINVEFISIGNPYREYLVSFELLVMKCKEIGLELLTSVEAKKIGLEHSAAMFEESHEMAKRNKHNYIMPDAVKQYSFLNRWFIFKRKNMGGPSVLAPLASFASFAPLAPLPKLPNKSELDPTIYKQFDKDTIRADADYARFITVPSSDYSVLKPWHKKEVKTTLYNWFRDKSSIQSIVDATAHIGVDSIYMSTLFPNSIVHSFEIVPDTFIALRYNIIEFKKEGKIIPYNSDITLWNPTQMVDFLFVDPPWGGKGYQDASSLELYLQAEGDVPNKDKNIKTLLRKWLSSGYIKNVVLKAPINFNEIGLPIFDIKNKVSIRNRAGKIAYNLFLFKETVDTEKMATAATAAPATSVAAASAASAAPVVPAASAPAVPAPASATEEKKEEKSAPVKRKSRIVSAASVVSAASAADVPPVPEKQFKFGDHQINSTAFISNKENIERWNALLNGPVDSFDKLPSNAARWLETSASQFIQDNVENPTAELISKLMSDIDIQSIPYFTNITEVITYNTMDYYLAAMKYKFTSKLYMYTYLSNIYIYI
jgi:predicted RNA methylase